MERQAKVNRILLGTTGVVLLGGGLLVLAAGLNVYRNWGLAPPAGWPLTTPHDVLLTHSGHTNWSHHGWWWPTLIAALALITLLALWWLLAQLRRNHPGRMPVGGASPIEGVELRDHAMSDALSADAAHLSGVHKAKAQISGRPAHPEARIRLTLVPGSAPAQTLGQLFHGPVERARRTIGWTLPIQTRLRISNSHPHRVS